MQAFSSQLEVYNFPLRERPREELNRLEITKARRRIEMAELEVSCSVTVFVLKLFIQTFSARPTGSRIKPLAILDCR